MLDKKYDIKKKLLGFIDNTKWLSSVLQFLHIRDTREAKRDVRTIYVNNVKPDDYDGIKPLNYKSNFIKTSKYTWWNFLPKNLFEQFRRVANFYFLINIIIIFIVPDPPTNPYTSMIPLLIVIVVTMIKQGYEDILRHNADRETNNKPIRILRDGEFKQLQWKDVICGDIVEVKASEPFPCDLILLYSHTEDQQCHITTANLDGETNLKVRSVPANIPSHSTLEELSNYRAVIQCDKPNLNLYQFKGKLIINHREYPMTNDNILLRGCCLRVSPLVYGCAVYTGLDTKMMKNSQFKSNKLSCIERKLNQFIFVFLLALAVLTFASFIASFSYINIYVSHWYLTGREPMYYTDQRSLYNFIVIIYYMNLYNYIVPLSMYVTIEMQRFIGSKFIHLDLNMYDIKTNQPAKANTSDLNEDLGQVEYLFSDKTGTLTENEMAFQQFSIDGVIYREDEGVIVRLDTAEPVDILGNERLFRFFEILSLCHTVQIDENGQFQASSPDEFCFIQFCLKIGIEYKGDQKDPQSSNKIRTVNFQNVTRRYMILQIFEFDSTRKRMSVILRDLQTKRILMLCKGAETAIFKKCSPTSNKQVCNNDIKLFAEEGWRTLALTYKFLSEDEYQQVANALDSASNDIVNREEKLDKAIDQTESVLELVGATAIEDKLQEDVAPTLESIRRAGIKIWVLTGDKKETAMNISHTCKHFSEIMIKLIITSLNSADEIKKKLETFKNQMATNPNESYALVIDGETLAVLFGVGKELKQEFCSICMKCDAVLCCRMSPAQKAEVVRIVKLSKAKPLTAAIGDGANDVSMIQEAHVGLGIFGKEGRNAARSADFAFAKFKFVRRILLVHGFLYYTRVAYLVQYFFYKNLTFVVCQFYYAFSNAFSVTTLYDTIILIFYNVCFTAAPILFFGLFEQTVSIRKIEKNAYLYRMIRQNKLLRTSEFIKWNSLALWHSLVCYFFAYALFSTSTPFFSDGKMSGGYEFGGLVIILIIVVVHVKLLIEWQYKTFFLLIGYFMSFLAVVVLMFIPNAIIIPDLLTSFTDGQNLYWIYFDILSKPSTWLLILLVTMTCLLPDIIIKVVENLRTKRMMHKLHDEEVERINKHQRDLQRQNTGSRLSLRSYSARSRPASTKVYKIDMNDGNTVQKPPPDVPPSTNTPVNGNTRKAGRLDYMSTGQAKTRQGGSNPRSPVRFQPSQRQVSKTRQPKQEVSSRRQQQEAEYDDVYYFDGSNPSSPEFNLTHRRKPSKELIDSFHIKEGMMPMTVRKSPMSDATSAYSNKVFYTNSAYLPDKL